MFERFTGDARGVVVAAQEYARRRGERFVGAGHLLLSIVSADGPVSELLREAGLTPAEVAGALRRVAALDSVDGAALAAIGIDLERVRASLAASFGAAASSPAARRSGRHFRRRTKDRCGGHIPFSAAAKRCLEQSLRESRLLADHQIGVPHLALAVLALHDGATVQILRAVGLSAPQLRAAILRRVRSAA